MEGKGFIGGILAEDKDDLLSVISAGAPCREISRGSPSAVLDRRMEIGGKSYSRKSKEMDLEGRKWLLDYPLIMLVRTDGVLVFLSQDYCGI